MNQTLIAELKKIVGEENVLTSPGDLYLYSFDAALDRAMPSAVVLPGSSVEAVNVVESLVRSKTPFVARGAATSLCGGPVPLADAVVVATTRLKYIGKLDKAKREVTVGPGVVNLRLQQYLEKDKLFFAPDPGSQKACTIGGNVAANAGGPHCLKYGVTSNHVAALDVVLPDGKFMTFRLTDPGYDMVGFFVGSEGTLGLVTSITLKLLPVPTAVRTMVVSFRSMEEAIQTVTDIISSGILPATLEAMDKTIVEAVEAFVHAGYPTEAEAVLLIEVDGEDEIALAGQVARITEISERHHSFHVLFANNEAERQKLWEGRRGAYAAMARLAPNVLVEDGAVPRTKLNEALRQIKKIGQRAGLKVALLFHAGDGNLHPQIIFDERDKEKTRIVKQAGYEMLKACVDLGGTISGEHGIGIDKREAMRWLFSRETLSFFRRLKNTFDPFGLANPEKMFPLVGKSTVVELSEPKVPIHILNALGEATPETAEQAVELVRSWSALQHNFGVQGSKSKYAVGENLFLNTTKLNRILDYDRGNLTITVQAGALLREIRPIVEGMSQYLWVGGEGTVGGVIATRASVQPPLRDMILGMRVLLPTGEVVSFGAKTMKNVAGYDVPKLLIGSWGTLGIILDVIFRLYPYPAKTQAAPDLVPFVLKDIHKKVKSAFDPQNILSPQLSMITEKDILIMRRKKGAPAPAPEKRDERGADPFWDKM